MPILAAIGLGLQLFSMSQSSRASKQAIRAEQEAAKRAKEAGEYTAQEYEGKAKDELAIGTQEMADEARKGRVVASNAKAIGAKSGAGGYESNIADISAEADYQMMAALFNRKQSSRDFVVSAEVARREGADAARGNLASASAYRSQARTNAIQGAANFADSAMTMYERYGQPNNTTTTATAS